MRLHRRYIRVALSRCDIVCELSNPPTPSLFPLAKHPLSFRRSRDRLYRFRSWSSVPSPSNCGQQIETLLLDSINLVSLLPKVRLKKRRYFVLSSIDDRSRALFGVYRLSLLYRYEFEDSSRCAFRRILVSKRLSRMHR